MDPVWIVVAFAVGLMARLIGLPPLVGFLVAGFLLQGMGVEGGTTLEEIADIGVHLLLFGIGLKLRPRSLLRPEIYAGTTIHMLVTVIGLSGVLFLLRALGTPIIDELSPAAVPLVAFALSFSSTVFAVKALEDKGEMSSLHGRTSIGILIMQDVIAILFLTISQGGWPSPWALLLLIGLPLARPLLGRIMVRCGHGELLVLFGLLLTIGAARGFGALGLKPDLGALIAGVVVAGHPKANELSDAVLSFKHLFLVGFFLSIGLSGAPTMPLAVLAVALIVAVPLKSALFFVLLTRFRIRARTATLSALTLANYSEFGLIVAALAAKSGWISAEWLVILAISLSFSFVAAAPINARPYSIIARLGPWLRRFETERYHAEEIPLETGDASILVFGLGRVGTGAYDATRARLGDVLLGIDIDSVLVRRHEQAGRRALTGDATDGEFWRTLGPGKVRLVMFTMPTVRENMSAIRQARTAGFKGLIAARAQYGDEVAMLKEQGADAAFNLYAEAGTGFAGDVCEQFGDRLGSG